MTPTPFLIEEFGTMAAGVSSVLAAEPILSVVLAAVSIYGIALYLTRKGRKAVQ